MKMKQYLFGLFEKSKAKRGQDGVDTMDDIWQIVLWSLWFLYLVVFPTCDPWGDPWEAHMASELALAGTPVAAGYFGVCWLIKGDLDHFPKAFRLPHYGSAQPCALCPAVSPGPDKLAYFSNFNKDATWKFMLYTALMWHTINPDPHPLFLFPYLSCLNVEPDELHIVHSGSSMYFLGSVLWLLCYRMMTGTPNANLARVWKLIVEAYQDIGTSCQYTSWRLSFFTDPKEPTKAYPKLKDRGGRSERPRATFKARLGSSEMPHDKDVEGGVVVLGYPIPDPEHIG